MILTIHNLAKEYAVLPSDALLRSNTFDLYVLDIATKWQIYQHNKAEKQIKNPNELPRPNLTVQQMQDMIAKVKQRSNNANI